MAGKAPLLLASVLFFVGIAGLALTSAEGGRWGPFQPRAPMPSTEVVVFVPAGPAFVPPSLPELFGTAIEPAIESETFVLADTSTAPVTLAAVDEVATPAPTPTLSVPGVSSDGGVTAAGATSTPPPVRIVNVAADDAQAPDETVDAPAATPEPDATPETNDPEATPAPVPAQ